MATIIGQLTRKSIVDRACRRAGNTALSQAPDYEAQIWLNQILSDLYVQFDWPFLILTQSVSLSGLSFFLGNLDTAVGSFTRPAHDLGLVVTAIDGAPSSGLIREVDRRTFDYLSGMNSTATALVPDVYTINYQNNYILFYPTISSTITANFSHYVQPAALPIDTSGDSLIPTFPWSDYLIQALFVAVLEYEMDGRANSEAEKRELMLQRIRNITLPSRSAEPTIPLDVNVFSMPFRGEDDLNWLR